MSEASIPVDPLNPGQVFACLGFMEAADIVLGDAEGGFDWTGGPTRFRLRAAGDEDPFARVLRFLAQAEVTSDAPHGSGLSTARWAVQTVTLDVDEPFPFPVPDSPATLPAALRDDGTVVAITYWGDATRRDNVKFWAGAGGYPGAALARDALSILRSARELPAGDPFAFPAPQPSSFRFDWRRDYVPVDVGFSPNDHGRVIMVGFPIVEMLAAIGLTHARPLRIDKLTYRYATVGGGTELLPPLLLRAGLGTTPIGLPSRLFEMRLDWPGQENQARCIVETREITP